MEGYPVFDLALKCKVRTGFAPLVWVMVPRAETFQWSCDYYLRIARDDSV